MKFIKKQKFNLIFLAILGIIVFTPLGFHIRVLFSTYIHFNPNQIEEDKQIKISSYNWQLTNLSDHLVNLNTFGNKVIIINFWATWCPPCVAEMPSLQKLYDQYKDEVVFLYVANDQKDKVTNFLTDHHFSFPVFFELSPPPSELITHSIPTTFILSKEGKIVIEKRGTANWNSEKIHTLLDKLIKS